MQICCICVLPFLILAIAKGFLLRLIKERVDPYKDWGPFLISCGIYQTCQSLEKGSLKEVTDWPPHHFYQAWKMSPDPHCFHAKTHDLTLFSLLLNFLSSSHLYSLYFLFLEAPLGYENIPRKWREKSVNIKSPFHRKVSSCVKEGLSSSIQNWIRHKKTERRALGLSFQNTHLETNWTKKL